MFLHFSKPLNHQSFSQYNVSMLGNKTKTKIPRKNYNGEIKSKHKHEKATIKSKNF